MICTFILHYPFSAPKPLFSLSVEGKHREIMYKRKELLKQVVLDEEISKLVSGGKKGQTNSAIRR